MLDSGAHFYETYRTSDDLYMSVGCIEPQFYQTFLDKLGLTNDDLPQFDDFDELKVVVASARPFFYSQASAGEGGGDIRE